MLVWAGHGGTQAAGRTRQVAQPRHARLLHVQIGRMNKLLQNVNLAGTSLFFQILGVSWCRRCSSSSAPTKQQRASKAHS